ncbi:sigma-70 family RNA polymerase sigma factor [Niallia circulans]
MPSSHKVAPIFYGSVHWDKRKMNFLQKVQLYVWMKRGLGERGKSLELDDAYRMYVNELYRYLYSLSKDHHTAEDLVQDAFYRAYKQLDTYDILEIKPWLFKVAYHAFIDYTRKRKRIVLKESFQEEINNSTPESKIVHKESFNQLLYYISQLSEKEANAIILCDFHQFPYKEAAAVLNLKENTVKSHVFRGRKKLNRMVQKAEEISMGKKGR